MAEVQIERNGIPLPSGGQVRPGEKVTYVAQQIGINAYGAEFILTHPNGFVENLGWRSTNFFPPDQKASLVATAPIDEGNYSVIAQDRPWFKTDPYFFTVSVLASRPPSQGDPLSRISDILRWTAIGAGVIMIGYFVIRSGLLSKSSRLTRKAIAENPQRRKRR